MTSVDPCYYFLELNFFKIPEFSEYFQLKKIRFNKIVLLQATDEFLIFRAITELKSFGFSCVSTV